MAYFTVTTDNILEPLDVCVIGDSREDLMPEADGEIEVADDATDEEIEEEVRK